MDPNKNTIENWHDWILTDPTGRYVSALVGLFIVCVLAMYVVKRCTD